LLSFFFPTSGISGYIKYRWNPSPRGTSHLYFFQGGNSVHNNYQPIFLASWSQPNRTCLPATFKVKSYRLYLR
jgi:hypothetical protein